MSFSGVVCAPDNQPPDEQYLALVRTVLAEGDVQEGRNGKVRMVIGASLAFDLTDGQVPILSSKRLAWKTCLRELLWFIEGNTSAKELSERGCKIWDANAAAYRERLLRDGPGYGMSRSEWAYLTSEEGEGQLGPVYGHQWRHWGDSVDGVMNPGIDQLTYAISQLSDPATRSSRRIIVSAWNVSDLDKMALPPCHLLFQFNVVNGDELVCTMYQRSADVGLGLPFNMASYGMLTHFVARAAGLRAKRLVMFLSNVHIYENHVPALTEQLSRRPPFMIPQSPYINPRLDLEAIPTKIDDIKEEHVKILNYEPAGDLKMPMSV